MMLALQSVIASNIALAAGQDSIALSVFHSEVRDDNVFRLPDSVDPASRGLSGKADTIATSGIRLDVDKSASLQRLVAGVSLMDTRYRQFGFLDFRSLNYDANWQWAVGRRWSGELYADRRQSLSLFSDYTNYLSRNIQTRESQRFTMDYWAHSDWHGYGGVTRTSLENGQQFFAENDFELRGVFAGVAFRPGSGDYLAFQTKQLAGSYHNREFSVASQFDNGFSQTDQDFSWRWALTGKSALSGHLGYLARSHEHFSDRDYSGWMGNIDFVYGVTGKSSLSLGLKRDLVAFQTATSSFYTADEIAGAWTWSATSSLSATTRASYGVRRFDGPVTTLPAGQQLRRDRVGRFGIDIGYVPFRWIELKGGAMREKRLSNEDSVTYQDLTAYVSATLKF